MGTATRNEELGTMTIVHRFMARLAAMLALFTLPIVMIGAMATAGGDGGGKGSGDGDGDTGDDDGDGSDDGDDGDDDTDDGDDDGDGNDGDGKDGFKSKASKDALLADLAKERAAKKRERTKRQDLERRLAELEGKGETDVDKARREEREKVLGPARTAAISGAVKAAAAGAGFTDPSDALALLSADERAAIDVDDETLEVDESTVADAIKALAARKPHLVGKRRRGKGGGDHQDGDGDGGGSNADTDGTAWSQLLRGKAGVGSRSR